MPRTGRRRSLSFAAAVLATLAAPAAAQAVTYTVKAGNGMCGGADTTCESLVGAAAVANSGDTVSVAPGTYAEAPNFTAANVTITGEPGVAITGSITFSGNGANPSVLQKVVVLPSTAGSSAVGVTGSAGVAVRDSLIASTSGIGMTIANGANEITRTTVVSGGGDAVLIQPGTAATSLTMNTSVLSAGASAAGLRVNTGVSQLPAPGSAGNATVTAQHITVAGSANGIVLDSSAATPLTTAVGNIAATVTDSIVLGASPTSNNLGIASPLPGVLPPVAPPNTAKLTFTGNNERTATAAALFLNPAKRNFHLRPDAAGAIDKASAPGPSPTDIDGQPRTAGAASDLGADEFVNEPPKAVLEIKTNPMRTGRPVAFDGSKSSDRETGAGGGIVRYHWEFGDGQSADTTTATTTHTYTREGDGTATLTVIDAQGLSSPPASAPIKLLDGAPPVIVITKPTANQKIHLTTRKTTTKTVTVDGVEVKRKTTTTKRTKIAFAGTAKDKSGVKGVVLVVERLSKTPTSTAATSSSATTTTKRCTWIDPKKGAVLRSCAKPILILAKLAKDGSWSYGFKSTVKFAAGLYRVTVVGQDNAGVGGNSAPLKDAIHRFRLVK